MYSIRGGAIEVVHDSFILFLSTQLIEFMNLFYGNLDARFTKFHVYNVLTMADDFMVVSGMPQNIGEENINFK